MCCEVRRICCLCESWESGGIESFLCNVLTRLDMSGLEVDIVAAELDDSVFTEALKEHGIRFYELSGSPRKVGENRRRFRGLLRERRYDVVHLNAFQALSLSYLHIAKEEGVAVRIAHSHNTALRKSVTRPIKLAVHSWARERYTKDATALWACSRDAAAFLFAADDLERRGFRFIPNGIDVERFRFDGAVREAVRQELGLDGKLVIGHVGRLCYQKNQSFLLDMLAETVKKRPDTVLLLVGEGEDRPMLEERTRELGIRDKVLFYGAAEHVERLYWAMDVFVFPSRFEGFGIAVIEAQAAGLAVVCSEGVPAEPRVDRCTALPLDAEAWASRLSEKQPRTPESAAVIRSAGFDIGAIASQIETIYRKGREQWTSP